MPSDKWLNDYENIEKSLQKISQNLNERSKYPRSSSIYIKLSSQIRTQLGKLNSSLANLEKNLENGNTNLTYLEKNRRINSINQLKTNQKQLEQMLRDENSYQNRDSLLIDLETDIETRVAETDETINLSTDQILSQHDRIIVEQDQGLETLSHIIQNQKRIATTIGSEVDRQNDLIDSIGDKMDQLDERLIRETRNIKVVSKKSATCGLWILIVLLLIAIIVIAAIPKP